MSLLWFCVLLLVASVCGNPPRVINLGTRFIPRFHNQYSDLVARILRTRGIRVYSVHDVGALTSTTLNRRFSGFSGDSSLGLENNFVRRSLAGGRPSVTYEELYGGVDTSDLPAAAVPLVGSTLGTGPYGPRTDRTRPYDLGPNVGPRPYGPEGDGPRPYGPGGDGPGPYGPGDGSEPYDQVPNVGSGRYEPGFNGLRSYKIGLSGSGLSGSRTNEVGIDGLGLATAERGVDDHISVLHRDGLRGAVVSGFDSLNDGFSVSSDSLLTERSAYPRVYYGSLSTGGDGLGSYGLGLSGTGLSGFETKVGIGGLGFANAGRRVNDHVNTGILFRDGLRRAGVGGSGSLNDRFSVSSRSFRTGTSSVYPSAYYGPISTGGRSSVYSSYQSTYPTYSDLNNRGFSSAELGAGAGVGVGAAPGSVFSAPSSFADTLPHGTGY